MSGRVYYSLYGRLLEPQRLVSAFKTVKKSRGAGGIDCQNIDDFEHDLKANILQLIQELKSKTYRPLPVKRVEIPKGNGGVRLLGIPCIRDRVVQQALLDILQPIFEEDFQNFSYGYRLNKSCHQAISHATDLIRKEDYEYVVDMDLSKCFDTLNHDIIIDLIHRRITDSSVLNLIKLFLKSGVVSETGFRKTNKGSPQGGVISPLIANIYLNEFDHFMSNRGYQIIRYADDILILCKSTRSANHALEVASSYLEKDLYLTVNKDKTHIAHISKGIKYLGVVIFRRYTVIQEKKVKEFKKKVKLLTKKTQCINLQMVIKRLNPLLRGFSNYFKICNCKKLFENLIGWIRRRLRMIQLRLWKKPRKLHRVLRQNGYNGNFPLIRMSCWRNSNSPQASFSMPNAYFSKLGLYNISKIRTGIIVPY